LEAKIAPELIPAIRSQHLLHHGFHDLNQRGVIGQHVADGSLVALIHVDPHDPRRGLVFPDDGENADAAHLLPTWAGASGPMYSYAAATLAEQTNSIVVAPSLTSNVFDPDAAWLGLSSPCCVDGLGC
jgi:hypothetical protein